MLTFIPEIVNMFTYFDPRGPNAQRATVVMREPQFYWEV